MSITKEEAMRCEALFPTIAAALCAKLNGKLTSLPPYALHTVFGLNHQEYNEAKREFPAIIGQLEALQKDRGDGLVRMRGGKGPRTGRPLGSVANPGPELPGRAYPSVVNPGPGTFDLGRLA